MKVELTSRMGWKPGKRELKPGEQLMLLLHVDKRYPVVVAEGSLVYPVRDALVEAGAEEISGKDKK